MKKKFSFLYVTYLVFKVSCHTLWAGAYLGPSRTYMMSTFAKIVACNR